MRITTFLLFYIGSVFSLLPKSTIDKVFTRHTPMQISVIFDVLTDYATTKALDSSGSDKKMYKSISKHLREGKVSIDTSTHETHLFLGWTPLKYIKEIQPFKNDNTGTSYEHVPIYFIFATIAPYNKKIIVEKIFYNPTIQVDIDPTLMKYHLIDLAKQSNTTLDLSKLKDYDNGRWHLILSEVMKNQMGYDEL